MHNVKDTVEAIDKLNKAIDLLTQSVSILVEQKVEKESEPYILGDTVRLRYIGDFVIVEIDTQMVSNSKIVTLKEVQDKGYKGFAIRIGADELEQRFKIKVK